LEKRSNTDLSTAKKRKGNQKFRKIGGKRGKGKPAKVIKKAKTDLTNERRQLGNLPNM